MNMNKTNYKDTFGITLNAAKKLVMDTLGHLPSNGYMCHVAFIKRWEPVIVTDWEYKPREVMLANDSGKFYLVFAFKDMR
jgi:hypothetical protein